ncbi:DUF1800 domain-containing protein [Sphingomonas mucosissima]|uniref:DUF1800 domain-containing protein n=1 Tax=Sphingomonas mucosissima TaxID=370959 RepID=A0A245ZEV5_9SPHN|nr:DUF1800 domain-containing protein [Sphingomonas mucosissima]OWK28243.1 hypothetical protein SPMU_30990 [Sphingomonas mucosissima]
MSERSIALNRFGLGARPDEPEIANAPGAARDWLSAQLIAYDPQPPPLRQAAGSAAILNDIADYQAQGRAVRTSKFRPDVSGQAEPSSVAVGDDAAVALRRRARSALRLHYVDAVNARVAAALVSRTPFAERMVHFWSNHFAVSADKISVSPLAGSFEFEAIRPHVMGKFSDMLKAAECHPAMLLYLDQVVSIGPGSVFGRRPRVAARRQGLNENLAREILELHTLGARTGYSQADVTEFARSLTGWTVPGIGRRIGSREVTGGSAFLPELHELGTRTILGKAYSQEAEAQAEAVLHDLAHSPATARHLATKLTRHFAGDTPAPAMVARLENAFLRSGGDLPTLYRTIILSPEAWVTEPVKFRSPWEWSLAALRALGSRLPDGGSAVGLQEQLGQRVWRPGQPSGFNDIAATWAGPDALMRRVEAAERLAQRAGATDARALASTLFPDAVGAATLDALDRAESPGQALALLLVAPEMMRR